MRKSHLFPLAYLLAMIPIAFRYPVRFTDHSLLPLSMLSGIGMAEFFKKTRSKKVLRLLLVSIVAASLLVDPTLIATVRPRPPTVSPEVTPQTRDCGVHAQRHLHNQLLAG